MARSSAKAAVIAAKSVTPVAGECRAADPARVGLDLAQLLGAEAAQARHAVRPGSALELAEPLELVLACGDDQLAVASRFDPATARNTHTTPRRHRRTACALSEPGA